MDYILAVLVTAVSNIATWYAARRKNLAEVRATELDNIIKAVKMYQGMLDDLAAKYGEAVKTIEERDAKIKILIEEIERLTEELKKYKQLNGKT